MVTPLIALGRQQLQRFRQLQIPAWCGVGESSQVQYPDQPTGVWVLSPERLVHLQDRVKSCFQPNLLIVDEAHCVFEWGENFRPAFGSIRTWVLEQRTQSKSLKTFWCSATLRPEMIQQISGLCGADTRVLGKFEVPKNIKIQRVQLSGAMKLQWIEKFLSTQANELSGLIYTGTRNLAEHLAQYLSFQNRPVLVYHAGMGAEERRALESKIEAFHQQGQVFLIIATSAFGMGMDYPALRFGILFDPPYSMLQLAQALGRVGRGGLEARVFALWCAQDWIRLKQLTQSDPKAHSEALRLEAWYYAAGPAHLELEKDFRQPINSGNIKAAAYGEPSVHSNRP